ncbi:MAG: hypothetical protein HYX51_08735 [Chloroflexi bacterium]|nr:hypothetical protein [Chloroflexota bacterium]
MPCWFGRRKGDGWFEIGGREAVGSSTAGRTILDDRPVRGHDVVCDAIIPVTLVTGKSGTRIDSKQGAALR